MWQAIDLARKAEGIGEVPVGALVVQDNRVVGEGWNCVISKNDPSAHAEVIAIRAAAAQLNNYRLPGCDLYVTIEPCTMCLGVAIHARLRTILYGASEPRAGMLDSNGCLMQSHCDHYNHKLQWQGGVLEQECRALMQSFFKQKRSKK